MTIGNRIRHRRKELNMSQDELAKKLGYQSRSSINKIEKDLRNLTQSKIKAIADALNTTPCYIMGWEEYDAQANVGQLAKDVKLFEHIEKRYGKATMEAFADYVSLSQYEQEEAAAMLAKFTRLDSEERLIFAGRVVQIMEDMLSPK